jgi:hypothetical protein
MLYLRKASISQLTECKSVSQLPSTFETIDLMRHRLKGISAMQKCKSLVDANKFGFGLGVFKSWLGHHTPIRIPYYVDSAIDSVSWFPLELSSLHFLRRLSKMRQSLFLCKVCLVLSIFYLYYLTSLYCNCYPVQGIQWYCACRTWTLLGL